MKDKLEKVVQVGIFSLIFLSTIVSTILLLNVGLQMINAANTVMVILGILVVLFSLLVFAVGLVGASEFVKYI